MYTKPETDPTRGTNQKRCRACMEYIHVDAKKCKHCQAFQDWRSGLSLWTTILALLVALLSVTTVLTGALTYLRRDQDSSIALFPQGVEPEHISLLAQNVGKRPARISDGELFIEVGESYRTVLDLDPIASGEGSAGIPAEETKEVFLVINKFGFRANREKLIQELRESWVTIEVEITHFSGRKEHFEFTEHGNKYITFLQHQWSEVRGE